MDINKEEFASKVCDIVESNSFNGCSLSHAEIEAECLYVETATIILKSVFEYGSGMNTHLNILGMLDKIGVKKEEYETWNK